MLNWNAQALLIKHLMTAGRKNSCVKQEETSHRTTLRQAKPKSNMLYCDIYAQKKLLIASWKVIEMKPS